jgi:hypothetical protein
LARHELETANAVQKRSAGDVYSSDRPVLVWDLMLLSFWGRGCKSWANVIRGLKGRRVALVRRWGVWVLQFTLNLIREVKMCHFHWFFCMTVLFMYLVLS